MDHPFDDSIVFEHMGPLNLKKNNKYDLYHMNIFKKQPNPPRL